MEMNDKAKHLVNLMKQGVVEFIFQKVSTGKKRKARGTLKRSLIPPEFQRKRGRPKKRPDYLVIYYDVDKEDIRSFRDDMLKKIMPKTENPVQSVNKEKSKKDRRAIENQEESSKNAKD